MFKYFLAVAAAVATAAVLVTASPILAQGLRGANANMMGRSAGGVAANNHTAEEEQIGQDIWKKLQGKEMTCANLTDNHYAALGEYFMGQMMGSAHAAMNNMMTVMMGESGEEQMHIVMGKRFSGCDTSAAYPSAGLGMMPMMTMMGGGGMRGGRGGAWDEANPLWKGGGNMMYGYGGSFGLLGWLGMLLMLVFWVLVIVALVAFVRWLWGQGGTAGGSRALDILKERYAKGEINKEEYEAKKRDLAS